MGSEILDEPCTPSVEVEEGGRGDSNWEIIDETDREDSNSEIIDEVGRGDVS